MSLKCKLALSTGARAIDEAVFRAYSENGIEAMEVSLGMHSEEELDYPMLKQLSEKYNIKLWSFHLPFAPFHIIDISNPHIAEQTVACFKDYIAKANTIGIKMFVIHASGEPIDDNREQRLACAKNSLKQLAEYASELGCTIAVEDLPRSCLGNCSKELLELVSVHDAIRICFDTNHLLKEDIIEFIHNVGSRLITTHVSDYDYIDERHWLPGEGSIDWVAVVRALKDIDYQGYWLYELGLGTPKSIERPRNLIYADFRQNYDELMQEKQPESFGQPKVK